jgi:hypothetical protein
MLSLNKIKKSGAIGKVDESDMTVLCTQIINSNDI